MPVASREHQEEQMYCAEQINIPVTFPSILKCYAKAAIRTQPYDLLSWTSAYFRAFANGDLPPVKERLEYPPCPHPSGITPRFLKILLNQYRHDEDWGKVAVTTEKTPGTMSVKLESLLGRWRGTALKDTSLYQILMTGRLLQQPGAPRVCDLYRFLAIACGLLGNNLLETMIYICELLTKEPDGGSGMISFRIFMNLYEYLADLDCTAGQSIIEPGQTNDETRFEQDEAPCVRSSHSSLSSSSFLTTSASSTVKETRALGCRSTDNSSEGTETEESICSFEVSGEGDEESASPGKASRGQVRTRDYTRIFEGASARKPCGCGDSTSRKTSLRAGEEAETTGRPRLESTSESTTYDDKKHLELKVPGCNGERLGGGGTEVTRVQEERRRRRDVEMHSRAEKVRLMVDVETTNTAECSSLPQPSLVSTATSPSRRDTSSSSSVKSHVVVEKYVKTRETATRGRNIPQEFDQTDKTLETRFSQLARQAGGADVSHTVEVSNEAIENISPDGEDPTTAQNFDRSNIKGTRENKHDRSANTRTTTTTTRNNEKTVRDSLEYDEPTTHDEDDFTSSKKRYSRRMSDDKVPSKEENVIQGRGSKGDAVTPFHPEDYAGVESFDDNENVEDEEFEEMAKYEPIGLENILEGICECLETTKDTKDLERASTSSQPRESSQASQPLDLVEEFIERMRVIECPTGSYVLPEVPGIGPPVSPEIVTAVGLWLTDFSRRQQGQVGPRNLRHFMCPNLDGKSRYEDYAQSKNTCCTGDESVVDLKKEKNLSIL